MGGTFNPIHLGHLMIAEEARQHYGLEKVIFIPSYITPNKDMTGAAAEQRLEMTRLATCDNPYFTVSDIEIQRKGFFCNISVYGYGPPEITRFFRFIAHCHDSALTRLYLIPSVVHHHAVAGSGDTLYAEHFLSCIVECNLFINSLIFTYCIVMVFCGI